MALYYEAAQLLTTASDSGGSFKSRIYNSADLKSNPSHLFALISEASRWSHVLKEVIEKSGILPLERKVRFRSSLQFHVNLLTDAKYRHNSSHLLWHFYSFTISCYQSEGS